MSRRRLCRGALALVGVGVAGVALAGGCSSDDPAGEAGGDGPTPDGGGGGPGPAGEGDGTGEEVTGDGEGGDAVVADPEVGTGQGAPVMYASPTCGCCRQYAEYLEDNGHSVEVRHVDDLDEIKDSLGVPAEAESCHTTMIGGYVVEGHVPVEVIDKLLRERPGIDGVALPGMPSGSPGMDGPKEEPFEILSINGGTLSTYMTL